MLSIRLSRVGKKKQPTYRVLVLPKTKDPWGDYIENLGFYNPRTKEINLKVDRIKYWISCGAEATNTVWNLLVKNKVIDAPKKKIKIGARKEEKK